MSDPGRPSLLRFILRRHLGLERFRPGQLEVVRSVLDGRDTLAIMPTGAGKSLCYQVAGLASGRLTVVVSPLLALVDDQLEKMEQMQLEVARLDSTLGREDEAAVLDRLSSGRLQFLLVTPERVARPEVQQLLRGAQPGLLVIDEAHCIAKWGHDFRPDYLELGRARAVLGGPTVLALTATAAPEVAREIAERLEAPDMVVLHSGAYRPNLHLASVAAPSDEDKLRLAAEAIAAAEGAGIVYVATVRTCSEVADRLAHLGFSVDRYHGRLGARNRSESQRRFMDGEVDVMVATNAFGMGIDKRDIRFVVHWDMPGSLDAYYHEAGRSGRDGGAARCLLLYDRKARATQLHLRRRGAPSVDDLEPLHAALVAASGRTDELASRAGLSLRRARALLGAMEDLELVEHDRRRRYRLLGDALDQDELETLRRHFAARREAGRAALAEMEAYAQSALCRWRRLLDHFHLELPGAADRCGHCDNCDRALDLVLPEERPDAAAAEPELVDGLVPEPLPGASPELEPGCDVAVPVYGEGTLETVGDTLTVRFRDGSRRRFRPRLAAAS